MSGYKEGDKFIVEITEVNSTGMGTVYYLNDVLAIDAKKLGALEPYTPVEEVQKKPKEKKAHTPEELKNKIFSLSKLLANTIDTYQKVTNQINDGVKMVDLALEDNENG